MNKTAVVTARITPETLTDLDRIAAYMERSRAWIVSKAVERYVAEESEFFAFIKDGEDDIDRGDFLTQEQMEAWFAARHSSADAA